jgi:hypothetical protein
MSRYRFIAQFCLSILLVLGASSAFAQATRTWISGVGDDVNPCSRTAPCKTFAGAISKTASGGTIDVLEAGGFGAVTITKPITLESVGTVGSILSSGVNGIVINTPGATDTVVLRGLSIDGAGTTLGTNAVRVLAVGKLVIERCSIQNYSANGIDFESSTANAQLAVSDTTINSSTGAGNTASGIYLLATGATGIVERSRLLQNGFGVQVKSGVLTLRGSVISQNNTGVKAFSSSPVARVVLDDVVVSDNTGAGASTSGSQATIVISRSAITNNLVGVSGVVLSFGDNRIFNNGTDGSPSGSLLLH